MEPDLLSQGFELLLAGMGTVFVFLTLLVGATTMMSALARRFAPPAPEPARALPPADGQPAPEVVAAIGAAIAAHRAARR